MERGPHASALVPDAIKQHKLEVDEKVKKGQVRVIAWKKLRQNLPPKLKLSSLAMVPHKSRKYQAILDLSFILKLIAGEIASVNDTTVATAPAEAMDQIGGALPRIIAAMAEADKEEVIFYAKWDIKDGFWRMVCEEGAEYNFAYVLPQERGKEPMIVIPTSLQMGWVNSPPYFGAATETARDIADEYRRHRHRLDHSHPISFFC